MGMYRCSRCDEFRDSDYNCCSEDPVIEDGLMCEDCADEVEEDKPLPTGKFTVKQQAIIDRIEKEEEFCW